MVAPDQHTKTLEAAEAVRRLVEGGGLLQQMLEAIKAVEEQPLPEPAPRMWLRGYCGCPLYSTCNNAACPRALRVTC